jgi:hypothetical protein
MPTSRDRSRRDPLARSVQAGSLLLVLTAAAPRLAAQAPGQAPADSLRVRRGDTLWDLARQRLGSATRWPDIFALNVGVVADPHWIYPGQRLRLPGELPDAAPSDASAVDVEELPSSASLAFVVHAPSGARAAASGTRVAADTLRSGEWLTMPFVAAPGSPHGAGSVVAGVDVGPSGSRTAQRRFQRYDRIVLTLPSDVAATPGNAVLLVRRGPDLRGGQVLLPTGVATIERQEGGLVTARLTRVFDMVEGGQAVVALPAEPATGTASDAAPLESRIAWIAGSAELPTLYSAVVLAAGAREGVREGDRFELVADGHALGENATLPETRAAVARVIRVTEFGSTALIVSQQQPAVAAGMRVRRLPSR